MSVEVSCNIVVVAANLIVGAKLLKRIVLAFFPTPAYTRWVQATPWRRTIRAEIPGLG